MQYPYTMILHIILHSKVSVMQHPFQLYLLKILFYFFYINDNLARTSGDNKKKALQSFIKVMALLFSIQCG
jgi:hypothetical protein